MLKRAKQEVIIALFFIACIVSVAVASLLSDIKE